MVMFHRFLYVYQGKPPFSYGFPMVFPLRPPFSYGKPHLPGKLYPIWLMKQAGRQKHNLDL
jgi:hypothetical protein